MKIFRHIGIFLAAAFAFAMALPALAATSVARTFRTAKDLVHTGIARVLENFAPETRTDRPPIIMLIQSCAYAIRLAKRKRPTIQGSWRMCPSC